MWTKQRMRHPSLREPAPKDFVSLLWLIDRLLDTNFCLTRTIAVQDVAEVG